MGVYRSVVLRSVAGLLAASALVVVALALPWPSDYGTAVALHDMPCADMDGDGEVTSLDEDIIFSYWGQNVPPAPPQADVDPGPPFNDLDVDIDDIQYVAARVGQFTDCQDTPIALKLFPDLVVESIADAQQPFDCTIPAGVKVTVRNVGEAPAGPSTTYVTAASQFAMLPTPALAAGEAVTLFSTVQGIPIGDTYTAVADFSDDVVESDETNNTRVQFLSLGTLPTCTPTPAATPTSTPTPPVGGIALDQGPGIRALETPDASSSNAGLLIASASAVVLGAVMLGGAYRYARRRQAAR